MPGNTHWGEPQRAPTWTRQLCSKSAGLTSSTKSRCRTRAAHQHVDRSECRHDLIHGARALRWIGDVGHNRMGSLSELGRQLAEQPAVPSNEANARPQRGELPSARLADTSGGTRD